MKMNLVGGFNPIEKYSSNWKSSPNRGENKKSLKPPPSESSQILSQRDFFIKDVADDLLVQIFFVAKQ